MHESLEHHPEPTNKHYKAPYPAPASQHRVVSLGLIVPDLQHLLENVRQAILHAPSGFANDYKLGEGFE